MTDEQLDNAAGFYQTCAMSAAKDAERQDFWSTLALAMLLFKRARSLGLSHEGVIATHVHRVTREPFRYDGPVRFYRAMDESESVDLRPEVLLFMTMDGRSYVMSKQVAESVLERKPQIVADLPFPEKPQIPW